MALQLLPVMDALSAALSARSLSIRLSVRGSGGEALRSGDTSKAGLSSYDRRCQEALGPLVARSDRVHQWLDRAPWWIDLLFFFAGAAPRWTQSFLNRMSKDFIVRVDG